MDILVVDDAPDTRLIIKSVLKKLGHNVTTAEDGEEAWKLLCSNDEFQIVISDWVMPNLDGLGLCQRIRNEPFSKYTYIILLTGMSGKTNLISGIAAGADDFATKPINSEELEVRLRSAKRILDLEKTLAFQNEELERANKKLVTYATTDGLTGLYNRRAFQEHLEETLLFSRRANETLSLLILDVDYFKAYNDTFGHVEGDTALKIVASILKENSRKNDFVARFGGEEFTVILPNTNYNGATLCAEVLRNAIEKYPWLERKVTISVGVTTVEHKRDRDENVTEMYTRILSEADQALYRSKSTGRNKVTHFKPQA
ncbi:diguanylate cyclase [Leucothrix pacifica]|uniref:diguanylate cyclase n=1 Tax=Leucothrix pacifica TaxID=1247513 RepID=A0A317CII6_9GAMM|nr:diguanylate cyclase [Leucothrix pacifica]PWQ96122.1 diguanylate cyclase response regulator [Leucothrix pacifica]